MISLRVMIVVPARAVKGLASMIDATPRKLQDLSGPIRK
jgi:hypothetical protein